jgi:predicted ATPase
MTNARFSSISVERFKSHAGQTTIPIGGLTVLIGKNNSGKSSIIQALLLLKQTLEFPKLDVPLHLEGMVEALSIRELTFGWPEKDKVVRGPKFKIRWVSDVDTATVIDRIGASGLAVMASRPETPWLASFGKDSVFHTETEISLDYSEIEGRIALTKIRLHSYAPGADRPRLSVDFNLSDVGNYSCIWNGATAKNVDVGLDHFLPYMSINKRDIGPRDRQRAWTNTFEAIFLQPLDDLRVLIRGFNYLSSARALPPAIYRFSSVAPDSIGVAGESAAQLLHAHKDKRVTFSSPSSLGEDKLPKSSRAPLQDAVNQVLSELGIETALSIHEIRDVGFRLLFGQANLQHVGRGLTYLLPIVELGLISDPLLFASEKKGGITLENANSVVCAFEEPEAHLHPKIQSRLAEWFVGLALTKRQIFVETHSDHLVRKLRYLIARAVAGGAFEKWLSTEVTIVQVEQNDGVSKVSSGSLKKGGGLEDWPAEFMEQALTTEEEIYVASLAKGADDDSLSSSGEVVHLSGDEPDEYSR